MAGAGYRLYTAGQVLTAAQVNTYMMEQSVMVFATTAARDAALTTIKSEGNITYQLDNNDLDIYSGSVFGTLIAPANGALTSWTPTITQSGSVTLTNDGSRYIRIGRAVWHWFHLTVTGSGTANNVVVLGGLPFTMVIAVNGQPMGVGEIYDSSAAAKYESWAYLASSTTIDFRSTGSAIANQQGLTGQPFGLGLAVGDVIGGNFWGEATTDA